MNTQNTCQIGGRQTMRDKRYMVTKWHEQLNKEEVRLRRYKL